MEKEIKGFLSLFGILFIIGTLITPLLYIYSVNDSNRGEYFGLILLTALVLLIIDMWLRIEIIYSLYQFNDNFVNLIKIYMMLTFINGFNFINLLWLIYFFKSKMVSELFPKEQRKLSNINKVLLIIYCTFCSIGFLLYLFT